MSKQKGAEAKALKETPGAAMREPEKRVVRSPHDRWSSVIKLGERGCDYEFRQYAAATRFPFQIDAACAAFDQRSREIDNPGAWFRRMLRL